jgi:hypothetical protein
VTDGIQRKSGVESARSIKDYDLPSLEAIRAACPAGVEAHRLADLA